MFTRAADIQPARPKYLIDAYLPRGQLVHVLGVHGAGKSMVLTDCAFHITAGLKWRGHVTHPCAVAYAAPLDGGLTRQRLCALAEYHKTDGIPRDLYLETKDVRAEDPGELLAEVGALPDLGLVVLDLGHVLSPEWANLTMLARAIRTETGATVVMLQEGSILSQSLSPGWDILWQMERTVNNLVALEVFHMRDSGLLGQLGWMVQSFADAAVLLPTAVRPLKKPRLDAELDLIIGAILPAANAANGYRISLDDFRRIVLELDLSKLREMTEAKRVNQQIGRWGDRLHKGGIVRMKDGMMVIQPAWRSRMLKHDLDARAEQLQERLFPKENQGQTPARKGRKRV